MATLNFPSSPTDGDTYTENDITYEWDTNRWVSQGAGGIPADGVLDRSLTTPERTITDTDFDLATGPYWTCGAIDVPNPTNAVSGMTGVIRLTDAPTSWGSEFSTPPTPTTFPAMVPFYVEPSLTIRLGDDVEVA